MAQESDEPGASEAPSLRRERVPTDDELEADRHHRLRRILGAVCLLIGLVMVAVAVRAATDGGSDTTSKQHASTTTTTAGAKGSRTSVASTVAADAKPQWPAAIAGRPPAFGRTGDPPPADAGDLPDGFYLWIDFDGGHAWLVGGGPDDTLTVTSDAAVSKAAPTGGPVDVQLDGNAFTLKRGDAGERVVGVDFNPGYFAHNMIVAVDGPQPIYAGAGSHRVPAYWAMRLEPR